MTPHHMNYITKYKSLDDYFMSFIEKCEKDFFKTAFSSKKLDVKETPTIPTIYNYVEVMDYSYSVSQLKLFAKYHKLKISGNKKELFARLYIYLKLSYYIVNIQKVFRGFFLRKFMKYHGPAYKKRKLCTNSTDFITMEDLEELSFVQFYSYEDNDGFIYGFDISSLYHLLFKSNKCIKHITNPYNRNILPENVAKDVRTIIRMSRVLCVPVTLEIEDVSHTLSNEKAVELRCLQLFQTIDSLGNYSDPKWFLSLNRSQIQKLIRELIDIWNYRAQLSFEIKRNICPPHGNPFHALSMHYIQTEPELVNVKKCILTVLEKFVQNSVDVDSKTLGAYYILGALTLVNSQAAASLPWLFQSFSFF